MSIKLGSTTIGSLYLGSTKIGAAYLGSTQIYESSVVDPLNPLGLPPYTIRLEMQSGWTSPYNTWTQVSSSPNVWDYTKTSNPTSWSWKFIDNEFPILSVLGFNATGITDFSGLFRHTSTLTSICLFDTSAGTNLSQMCAGTSITSIPLYNTSSATNMNWMFDSCTQVASGALALYQQASSQATPPSNHTDCFTDCGSATQTGAAELAQIPQSWGGTAGVVQTCPNCNGTGLDPEPTCPKCGGTGGSGEPETCPSCGGSGSMIMWHTCGTCGGSGMDPETGDPCDECGGSGGYETSETCGECGGSGTIGDGTCDTCNGTGHIHDGDTISCLNCNGEGYFDNPCDVCGGSGSLAEPETCWNCNGTGTDPNTGDMCENCGGSGEIWSCQNCGGTGRIYQQCDSCQGTGQIVYHQDCATCNGTGHL